MRRLAWSLASLAVAALLAGAVSQQAKCKGTPAKKPYCAKCEKVLGKDDVKGGKCAKDETPVSQIDVCVKKDFKYQCQHANTKVATPGSS